MLGILLTTIKTRWLDVVNGFWLVPGLIALCGPLLSLLFIWLDHAVGSPHLPLFFNGNATAASGMLSAIAASFIAALSLVFSITIVTLQLVTSQYTPRALRGFLADRLTQSVAGSFLGIFAYALLVLTAVREPESGYAGFVPSISITVAIGFSFLGLLLLLLFFHHTAESIQIYNITARLAKETMQAIDHLYPTWGNGSPGEDETILLEQWEASALPERITPTRSGYVQSIAFHHLQRAATRLGPGLRLHLVVCPGDFVTPEMSIAHVWVPRELEHATISIIRRSVVVVNQRDIVQDAAFGIRQLTDIALRALSPAVNDPTTAVNCIEYLQAIFEHLAHRTLPSAIHHLGDGSSLLVMRTRTFHEYLQAFVELGRVSTTNARVANALLMALEQVARIATQQGQERLPVLGALAQAIARPAIQDARTQHDRSLLEQHLQQVEQLTGVRSEQIRAGEQTSVSMQGCSCHLLPPKDEVERRWLTLLLTCKALLLQVQFPFECA
ncbi:hypothetical protein KSF_002920 [Reticulibacter mediterranei]|uniref:DUF2254 domain-containing protein n=1 Tax=Reticulibacter mediterranei TaxID=2778369 RepID=A0A8J3IFF8_9CHLR|nr:DUF2254 domain-containing protein [Reticulibacter mediterranei]GHO90244.1 hypothetical protein KSF_002920 [Reticulibacter mediterranei]